MKKYVSLILILLSVGMLILASCMGGEQPSDTDAATENATDPTETTEADTTDDTADETTEAITTEAETTEPVDPLAKYQLGYGSTMDMSGFDPI